jgi:hypothetical protein
MRRHLVTLAVAAAVALGAVGAAPLPALADSQVPVSATTTYELLPDKGHVRVTVVMKITNRIPSTTRTVPCGSGTCQQTTRYYIDEGWVWVAEEATDLRIVADRGSVTRKVDDRNDFLVSYHVRFQSIFRGATRTLTATYVIPGGKPRSDTTVRAGKAFASFCGISQATDTASVRVVVPAGYDMETWGGELTKQEASGKTVYASGPIAEPGDYWFCMSGTNPGGYVASTTTSPNGQTIRLEGWPEDPDWMTAVRNEAGRALARLETLFGLPVPGEGEILVREVAAEQLGGYSGVYTTNDRLALIGEDYTVEGLVTHELAHAWFNERTYSDVWLNEGYAGWAESAGSSGDVASCTALPFPGTGEPRIVDWKYVNPRSTEEELAIVDYQYAAACDIVTTVAFWIGEERMRDALATVNEGTTPYAGSGEVPARGGGPRSWRQWLDAVDERGMVPAGRDDLGQVSDLLVRYGAIVPASVEGREEARAAYHELEAAVDGWQMPSVVRAPMTTWAWAEATAAIEDIAAADAAVDETEALLPDVDATQGPVRDAIEAAATAEELDAARELAEAQARAAAEVAAMLEAVETPREPLEQLGLVEVEFEPLTAAALAAVERADEDGAAAEVAKVEALLDGADDTGTMRLAAIVGSILGVLLLLVLAVVLLRRRRRPGVAPVAMATMAVASTDAGAAGPVDAPATVDAADTALGPSDPVDAPTAPDADGLTAPGETPPLAGFPPTA